MNIQQKLITILNEKGVYVEAEEIKSDIELNINSLTFISIALAIENDFDIMIPDQYMVLEELNTFPKIMNMIKNALKTDTASIV